LWREWEFIGLGDLAYESKRFRSTISTGLATATI